MKDLQKEVTATIQIGERLDFSEATIASWKEHYPDLAIVGATWTRNIALVEETSRRLAKYGLQRLIHMPGCTSEEVRNAMAFLVRTKYMLILDDDVKCLGKEALPLLYEPFEKISLCGCVGAYAAVIAGDRDLLVGTNFDGIIPVDFSPGYCTLQPTQDFLEVGGWPHRFVLPMPFPDPKERQYLKGCTGDFSFGKELRQHAGLQTYTPAHQIPVLHWGKVKWFGSGFDDSPSGRLDKYWYENIRSHRLDPFTSRAVQEAKRVLS